MSTELFSHAPDRPTVERVKTLLAEQGHEVSDGAAAWFSYTYDIDLAPRTLLNRMVDVCEQAATNQPDNTRKLLAAVDG